MELRGVAHRYRRRGPDVLHDVDLDLPPGTLVRVAGRNGAGKSTLLRLVAGLSRPARGSVRGRPATVGWAPERFPAAQPVTVAEHLAVGARLRGVPATTVDRLVDRLGLGPLRDVRLDRLSSGSAQKVGLVQAVAGAPGLVVLDEPFAGLDAAAGVEVGLLVAELRAAGSRVLVTDHEQRLGELPDAVWQVADGRVTAGERPGRVVLRVEVAPEDAGPLAARLRAEGHAVSGDAG